MSGNDVRDLEQKWRANHPECFVPNTHHFAETFRANALAIERGIKPGSAEHESFLNRQLGYEPIDGASEPAGSQFVTLSAQERAIAKAVGISDLDYAENKLRAIQGGFIGPGAQQR